MADSRNQYWRAVLASERARRGDRCEDCGAAHSTIGRRIAPLEFAHVRPTGLAGRGRGRNHRARDIKRNPGAYRLLCHKCHYEADRIIGEALPGATVSAPAK